MTGSRICAIVLLVAASYAVARAQDSTAARDTVPRFPGKSVEITAPRETGLAAVNLRGIQIKPAKELTEITGSELTSDALRGMSSSLNIRRYGPLGSIAVASVRGLPAEYTTIYRDGIRLTNEQLGETDLGQLTLHGLSGVEFIPASAAVLLGGDAIGASINFASKFYDSEWLRLGSEQTSYAHASGIPQSGYYASLATPITEKLDIVADGSLDESNWRFPFYQDLTHSYVLRENNDATLHSADLNAEYNTGHGTLLKLISNYFSAERGSPGEAITPYRGATSLDERLADEQSLAAVKLEHSEANWSGWVAADYQNQYEAFRGATEGLGDTATNTLYALTSSANTKLSSWLTGYGGIDLLETHLSGSSNELPNGSSNIGRSDVHAYAAASAQPLSSLKVAPSLRAEYVSDLSSFELLPQGVIEYSPVATILLSTAYSRNFNAPTLNALYWKGLGNPNLKPEQADEGEASAQFSPIIFGMQPSLGVTYFYIHAEDAILWLPAGSAEFWRPFNVGVAESNGWELNASATWDLDARTALHFEESYTILSARNLTAGDSNYGRELIYSSPTQSLFIATFSHAGWGSLAITAHYHGHEFTDPANTPLGELPPVTLYDLTLTSPDIRFEHIGFRLFASIQNLTDVNYEEIFGYPMPGRTYTFSIELDYH